jgi:hypothetical protein
MCHRKKQQEDKGGFIAFIAEKRGFLMNGQGRDRTADTRPIQSELVTDLPGFIDANLFFSIHFMSPICSCHPTSTDLYRTRLSRRRRKIPSQPTPLPLRRGGAGRI